MIRILVVEDESKKLRDVIACLQSVDGVIPEYIEDVRDVNSAKRRLKENSYDLLILDLVLPRRRDQPADPEAGATLLTELQRRGTWNVPRDIIGLTAYPEHRTAYLSKFEEGLFALIYFDPTSDTWIEQLQTRVRHILMSKKSGGTPDYDAFLCIVTALPKPELQAIRALPWNWKVLEQPLDPTTYYEGLIENGNEKRRVVAASCTRMGMPAAAALSMKMIMSFRPRYLAMAGIAAGVRGSCELGDVIAFNPTWDWGSGKRYVEDGESLFAAQPHQIALDPFIESKLLTMMDDRALLDEIARGWTGPHQEKRILMHMGPAASGAAVLQDDKVAQFVRDQHRKLVGIDMETYGVFVAAQSASLPLPKVFSIKSICDFADQRKDDEYQQFAAYTSAKAVQVFAERFL